MIKNVLKHSSYFSGYGEEVISMPHCSRTQDTREVRCKRDEEHTKTREDNFTSWKNCIHCRGRTTGKKIMPQVTVIRCLVPFYSARSTCFARTSIRTWAKHVWTTHRLGLHLWAPDTAIHQARHVKSTWQRPLARVTYACTKRQAEAKIWYAI